MKTKGHFHQFKKKVIAVSIPQKHNRLRVFLFCCVLHICGTNRVLSTKRGQVQLPHIQSRFRREAYAAISIYLGIQRTVQGQHKTDSSVSMATFLYHCCNPLIPLQMAAVARNPFPNPSFSKPPARSCLAKRSSEPIEMALHRAVIKSRTAAIQILGQHAHTGLRVPPGCYHSPSGDPRRTWPRQPAFSHAAQAHKRPCHVHSLSGCLEILCHASCLYNETH